MTRLAAGLWSVALGAIVPVALLVAWERGASSGAIDPVFFPPPSRIWDAFRRQVETGALREAATTTVGRMLIGWAIAGVLGAAGGVLLGRSHGARTALTPTVEFLRAMPAAAIVPVALLVMGPSASMEIAVVAFAGVWPVLLNTTGGVVATEPLLLEAARVCGLGRWRQATRIQLPAAVPGIAAGLRISLAICLVVAVISEMVASTAGLGNLVVEARSRYRNADVYAIVAVLGVIGLATSITLHAAERRLTRWQQPVDDDAAGAA